MKLTVNMRGGKETRRHREKLMLLPILPILSSIGELLLTNVQELFEFTKTEMTNKFPLPLYLKNTKPQAYEHFKN
jgi:hypothetical protein